MKKNIVLLFLIILLACEVDKKNITESPINLFSGYADQPKVGFNQNGEPYYNFEYSTNNEFIYGLMKEIYLWNEDTPELTDVNAYETPMDVMNALRADQDIWSYMITKEEYLSYFSEGEFLGYGFSYTFVEQDIDIYTLRVTSMQENSVFYSHGIRRGDILSTVDDIEFTDIHKTEAEVLWFSLYEKLNDGSSHDFTFISNNVGDISINAEPSETNIKSINSRMVYNFDDMNIGYMAMEHFIEPTADELIETFDFFTLNAIDELIIDFRGNGGGQIYIASILIDILLGDNQSGNISYKYKFNDKYSHENFSVDITYSGYDFDFNRVVFLTDRWTASASELVISSLEPYIDVILVGETTHGKPVGMIGFENNDNVYFPISFKIDNANDFGGYYYGLPVDSFVYDEISYDYGDPEDPVVGEAIRILTTNQYSNTRSLYNKEKLYFRVDSALHIISGLY